MRKHRRTLDGSRVVDVFLIVLLVLFTLYTLFPFYWMITTALKPASEILVVPPKFYPSSLQFENIPKALSMAPFGTYFLNSSIVTVTAVIITVFINLLAGFSFAKYSFPGKNALFLVVLSTLMIPMQITMVPNFIILSKLGWLTSLVGLIIPSCAEAFGLFLARQFISEIPDELIEATRVDGAGELRIFFSVIVPNCHALIGVLVIFTFMWRWNDFLWPLIVVKDQAHYTVQLGLKVMQSYQYVDWSSVMSASLVCILPMVVVFACFQRFFVQGIAASGIKG